MPFVITAPARSIPSPNTFVAVSPGDITISGPLYAAPRETTKVCRNKSGKYLRSNSSAISIQPFQDQRRVVSITAKTVHQRVFALELLFAARVSVQAGRLPGLQRQARG